MDDKSLNLWRQIETSRRREKGREKERAAPPAKPKVPAPQGAGT